jgi:putative adenylate-forming enzyme
MIDLFHSVAAYAGAKQRWRRWRSRVRFDEWRTRRLEEQLAWVARHSAFYREHFQRNDRDVTDLTKWPIVTKRVMMSRIADFLTQTVEPDLLQQVCANPLEPLPLTKTGLSLGTSSGTTGSLGVFVVSARERAVLGGLTLARLLRGPIWQPQKVAFFLRANSPVYGAVGKALIRFEFFSLADPFPRLLERLEALNPTILIAPPSMLNRIAEAIRLAKIRIQPQQVISVAEVLENGDRDILRATFRTPVDEVYQATEGFLGATCRCGELHWNEDWIFIEREPLGDGRYTPIITDLFRRTQPIVRYRLDDLIIDRETRCPCGSIFQVIERIEGRSDDVIHLPRLDQPNQIGWLFPDYVRLGVTAALPQVEDFRVVQTGLAELSVSIRPPLETGSEAFLGRMQKELLQICDRSGLVAPSLRLSPWPEEGASQKRRRVKGLK